MAIESLTDLTGLSVDELYSVYVAIARADHRWRIQALYGDRVRPAGHAEFRPLPFVHFQERLAIAGRLPGGERSFRGRLARQAAAYQIDVDFELRRHRTAA